jgi:hypothetical protein
LVIVTYTYDLATVGTIAGSQALILLLPLKWGFSGRLSLKPSLALIHLLVVIGSTTLKIG